MPKSLLNLKVIAATRINKVAAEHTNAEATRPGRDHSTGIQVDIQKQRGAAETPLVPVKDTRYQAFHERRPQQKAHGVYFYPQQRSEFIHEIY